MSPGSRYGDGDLAAPVAGGAIVAGAHPYLVLDSLLEAGDGLEGDGREGVTCRISPGMIRLPNLCP